MRHAYVHDRLIELAELGHTRETRMMLVSQKLGHFRLEIVNEYLRQRLYNVNAQGRP